MGGSSSRAPTVLGYRTQQFYPQQLLANGRKLAGFLAISHGEPLPTQKMPPFPPPRSHGALGSRCPRVPRCAGGSFVLLPAPAAPGSGRADLCLCSSRPWGWGGATRRLPNLPHLHNSSSRPPLPPPLNWAPSSSLWPPTAQPSTSSQESVPDGSIKPGSGGWGQLPAVGVWVWRQAQGLGRQHCPVRTVSSRDSWAKDAGGTTTTGAESER